LRAGRRAVAERFNYSALSFSQRNNQLFGLSLLSGNYVHEKRDFWAQMCVLLTFTTGVSGLVMLLLYVPAAKKSNADLFN